MINVVPTIYVSVIKLIIILILMVVIMARVTAMYIKMLFDTFKGYVNIFGYECQANSIFVFGGVCVNVFIRVFFFMSLKR